MGGHGAIVLAGNGSRRLGGADKPGAVVGGRTLLEAALDAVTASGASTVVAVGPARPTPFDAVWTEESPAGGGPAAAIAAGLDCLEEDVVLVVAADLPFAGTAVPRLLAALAAAPGADGAVLVDAGDRPQPLLAAYRAAPLRAAVDRHGKLDGSPLHTLLADLGLVDVAAKGDEAFDCDTPADLEHARAIVATRRAGAGARS